MHAPLQLALDDHRRRELPRLDRLWAYYRNTMAPATTTRGYRQAQESGLPPRIVGKDHRPDTRREVVVENDIAWRVQTMVDFLLGRPVTITSTAPDPARRAEIDAILDAVWERAGGISLLQDIALLGQVFGHVDLLIRPDHAHHAPSHAPADDLPRRAAKAVAIEVIEPRRGVPVLDPHDYRELDAYIIRVERDAEELDPGRPHPTSPRRRRVETLEILGKDSWSLVDDGRVIARAPARLIDNRLPIVHVQNIAEPFAYSGVSEVEPLIPLQDELNTRLSDRACRVTMQSFKMYLAKGLEGFENTPVGPGQIWHTNNPDAGVQAFGGDAASPSESEHIREIREALDKVSGVPPLASGAVQGRIGNLTSANALRITLMGVLAKTARKRITYGRGITQACSLILGALHDAGIFRTHPHERGVRLTWPDPLPEDVHDQMLAAKAKHDLGVPTERVLAELGYRPNDAGLTG